MCTRETVKTAVLEELCQKGRFLCENYIEKWEKLRKNRIFCYGIWQKRMIYCKIDVLEKCN